MRGLPAALLSFAFAGPAMAQTNERYAVTKFQDLEQSMQVLLTEGYTIVNETIGGNNLANFLLRRQDKWVTCSLHGVQQATQVVVVSRCTALN